MKASHSGLTHRMAEHSLKGSEKESLFTDYFYTLEKKKKVLLHLSGVHGVEGYIGSLIQAEILSHLKKGEELPFQLVIVHAVNPYGMSWFHRTNANKVDLNRNSLKEYNLDNPHFFRFRPFLHSKNIAEQILEFFKALPVIAQIGVSQTVRAVASGQSEFPDSLFFTGHELQEELKSLIRNLKEIISDEAEVYALDVHSGLGKFSGEMLIVDSSEGADPSSFFQDCFKAPIVDPLKEKHGYPARGSITSLLKQTWPKSKIAHVFQEFGTRNFFWILRSLIKQNDFIPESDELTALKNSMLHSFFPSENKWRETCTEKGLERFQQLKKSLQS